MIDIVCACVFKTAWQSTWQDECLGDAVPHLLNTHTHTLYRMTCRSAGKERKTEGAIETRDRKEMDK